MAYRKYRTFVGDFETTVYDGQDFTEVWASALVELNTEDVVIHHSIDDAYKYIKELNSNVVIYYHNLKFDGHFWIYFLINTLHLTEAWTDETHTDFEKERKMPDNSFKYMISDMGQWYSITMKINRKIIQLRDSLKLLPFSVERIGKAFNTKHKKLDMEYEGFRYSGCTITEDEKKYIANDVLVVKEALEIFFAQGHNKTTIGSNCLAEFKSLYDTHEYNFLFPNLYEQELDDIYGANSIGEYINKSYKGGWCYLVKGKENKIYNNGTTADVNSLYPSMMSSESGNYYPIGKPKFWKGNYIPKEATENNRYYFIRLRTRFYIKPNMLPCIQIKRNAFYKSTEWLTTSDIYSEKTNTYNKSVRYENGSTWEAIPEMTLTMTDYELIKDHYCLEDTEILDGCYFETCIGLFDKYMEKYKQIKLNSKGAMRELAKLFLNNLYGKMASNTRSSFKSIYMDDESKIAFHIVPQYEKTPGYIPIGSAITSYARNFTIRTAQKNYYGVNNRGFIYADTDSIHCDLLPSELKGLKVDDRNFCCWKLEGSWDEAWFCRQKTYIEHITHENLIECNPHYEIKCAGMSNKCKELFLSSITGNEPDKSKVKELKKEDIEFLSQKRTITDFKQGLIVPGKLIPKRIKGGVVLTETNFEMR